MINEGQTHMVMDMTDAEFNMYGISEADIDKQFHWMVKSMGTEMTVISLLSDVQEVISRGDVERGRKWINIAKYLISEKMDAERSR